MRTFWRVLVLLTGCTLAGAVLAADDAKLRELEAGAKKSLAVAVERSDTNGAPGTPGVNTQADELTHAFRMQRESNKLLEAGFVSGLAVALLLIVLGFLSKLGPEATPHMVNATGLICIVFGTILLVLMAETDQQLTASVGILGAVAGYLFRSMRPEVEPKPKSKPAPGTTPPSP